MKGAGQYMQELHQKDNKTFEFLLKYLTTYILEGLTFLSYDDSQINREMFEEVLQTVPYSDNLLLYVLHKMQSDPDDMFYIVKALNKQRCRRTL
jgi:hypothetical protein